MRKTLTLIKIVKLYETPTTFAEQIWRFAGNLTNFMEFGAVQKCDNLVGHSVAKNAENVYVGAKSASIEPRTSSVKIDFCFDISDASDIRFHQKKNGVWIHGQVTFQGPISKPLWFAKSLKRWRNSSTCTRRLESTEANECWIESPPKCWEARSLLCGQLG